MKKKNGITKTIFKRKFKWKIKEREKQILENKKKIEEQEKIIKMNKEKEKKRNDKKQFEELTKKNNKNIDIEKIKNYLLKMEIYINI